MPDGTHPSAAAAMAAAWDALLEGVQVIDHEFRYLYLNAAAAEQGRRPRESLVGRTMGECYPGIEDTPLFATLRRCLAEQHSEKLLNRFEYPDGREGWFELRISPVPQGLCILSIDVTAQRRTDALAQAADRMDTAGRLALGVAHDFNNLLSVILTYAEFALGRLDPGHPAAEDVREVISAAERSAALTGQLLALSRRRSGPAQRIDLGETVRTLTPTLRRLAGPGVEVRPVFREATPPVELDPGRLEQVLMNLVVNARDAMPDGGVITIEGSAVTLDHHFTSTHLEALPGPHVVLAVSDTGTGMDAPTKARAFEPFFTTKAAGRGTGLGLSTVFGIVKQAGGTIWLYSEPGRGTTFKLYFPQADGTAPIAAGTTPAPVPEGTRRTVLVVEDDPPLLAAAQRILAAAGYDVITATTPDLALAAAIGLPATRTLHLLLADLVLPGSSGPELASRIAGVHPHVRVLFTSGYTHDATIEQRLLGPDARLATKPFTAASLLRDVADALAAPPHPSRP